MELVDSHCHLDFPPLGDKLDAILESAEQRHVRYFLCVAVNLEDYPGVLEIARQRPNVRASLGVHPNETEGEEASLEVLTRLGREPSVVAIGETGLDFFRSTGDLGWQFDRFRCHIEAARQIAKPLIIHSRDANNETIEVMRETKASEAGGVMHCFCGDWPMAKAALDLGFYISFSGIVTFKSADQLRQVAANVPMDRILVETDSPYLAPVPYRGKTNMPAYTYEVAAQIAKIKNLDIELVAEQTTDNFFELFTSFPRC